MASQFIQLPVESGGGGPPAGVDSFNGRTGVVVSQAGDYSAGIVSNTPAGSISATTVQDAINELDSEKQDTITGAATTIVSANLPVNRALVSGGSGKVDVSVTNAAELAFVSGVTSSIQTQLNSKQASDPELDAIAALATDGLITKTGAGTAATRTITAGSAAVTVTNGNGVAGNPTVDLPNTGVSAGAYGSATSVAAITVDVKGKVTAATDTAIAIPSTQVTNFTTAAQSAAVQNALFPASTVKAPSVDAVVTALGTVATNPMTAVGDLIRGGTAGAPTALPIGGESDILRVVGGIPAWEAENLTQDFGDGSDGNLTVSGALTLSQIPYYDTLTIEAGAVLNTGGYPIYCKTLDLTNATTSGAIIRNGTVGGNSAGAGGGAAGGAVGSAVLGGSVAGTAGANGANNAGAASGTPSGSSPSNGGAGGNSGTSGAGTPGAGVASGAGGTATNRTHLGRFEYQFLRGAQQILGGAGGDGGNSGGGDGANSSRGGGGGGSGGGVLVIYAANIITSGSTASNLIQAVGGNGGNAAQATVGNVGGSSGGGGGGGGFVYLAYAEKTGPVVSNLINCSGGTAGTSSNGFGTGLGANGSNGGNGGGIQTFNVTTGLGVRVDGALGGVGTAAVGITAGAPGTGGSAVLSL